jgi:DinB superfamily
MWCAIPWHRTMSLMAEAIVRESVQTNLKFRWTALIRSRLEGLTDAEYLWEPAAGCLTIRPGGDGYVLDPVRSTDVPPLGNIAWRMAHLAFSLSAHPVAVVAFGSDWARPDLAAPAGTAGEALACLDRAHAHWEAAVGRLSDLDLARNLGPAAGEYSESTVLDLVLHIHAEALQRGADLCLLRDLYWYLHGRPA